MMRTTFTMVLGLALSPAGVTSAQTTADLTQPSVVLTRPVTGTTISRRSTITMEASASDNVGVALVEFSVNGELKCRVARHPYRCRASTGARKENRYVLTARAVDAAGNAASSSRTYLAR